MIGIGLVVVLLLIVGFVFLQGRQNNQRDKVTPQTEKTEMEASQGTEEEFRYGGQVIAGSTTPYVEFTKSGYDQALAERKIIILNFYANWCPVCRAETPDLAAGFESLNNPNVVGFRVNWNDSDTDDDEKALAKAFSVPNQHTKVILINGKAVYNETEQWSKEDLVQQINAVL